MCSSQEAADKIKNAKAWGRDAFGSARATCRFPGSNENMKRPTDQIVWSAADKAYVNPCKVVIGQVPVEYHDSYLFVKLFSLGIIEVKTLVPPAGQRGAPLRLVTFASPELAKSALSNRLAFAIDGCAYQARYFKAVHRPVQCQKCMKFGHPATMCEAWCATCRLCGKAGHAEGDPVCKAHSSEANTCANCQGNHPASSSACPALKDARRSAAQNAQKISATRSGRSYSEVVKTNSSEEDKGSKQPSTVSPCNQCNKLVGAFIAILVSTHREKDTSKVVERSVSILESMVPSVLEDPIVARSLGLNAPVREHQAIKRLKVVSDACADPVHPK